MTWRVIVDENAGPGTEVWAQFQRAFADEQCEYVFLATAHRGIPDVEILDKLLRPDAVLLTGDCVLHTRVLEQHGRSYTLSAFGQLTHKRLPDVRVTKALPKSVYPALQADYLQQPVHGLTRRLTNGFSERQFKHYRTARRRIHSHFGAAAAICEVSLTIGSMITPRGLLYGFVMHVAGSSGVKGLRATEGYCQASGLPPDAAWPLLHALRDQYLLHLDQVRTQLFVIPPASLELAQRLLESDQTVSQPVHEAVRQLMRTLATLTLHPCVKGPFQDAMRAKLTQLSHPQNNEVTSFDFGQIATGLLNT